MASDSRTHTPTLDNDDLETILSIARNKQSGRITRREAEALVAAYRAHDGLVEALREIAEHNNAFLTDGSEATRKCLDWCVRRARRALEAAGITEATDGR